VDKSINPMLAAQHLTTLTQAYRIRFESIELQIWKEKPDPDKWSKQEELGHLIDSALTNLRRFVVTQYQADQLIVYDQNQWVKIQAYQTAQPQELIQLWYLLNCQLARVWSGITIETASFTTYAPNAITLSALADDYLLHLEHHVHHILGAD
jgi:hypothetical protein